MKVMVMVSGHYDTILSLNDYLKNVAEAWGTADFWPEGYAKWDDFEADVRSHLEADHFVTVDYRDMLNETYRAVILDAGHVSSALIKSSLKRVFGR